MKNRKQNIANWKDWFIMMLITGKLDIKIFQNWIKSQGYSPDSVYSLMFEQKQAIELISKVWKVFIVLITLYLFTNVIIQTSNTSKIIGGVVVLIIFILVLVMVSVITKNLGNISQVLYRFKKHYERLLLETSPKHYERLLLETSPKPYTDFTFGVMEHGAEVAITNVSGKILFAEINLQDMDLETVEFKIKFSETTKLRETFRELHAFFLMFGLVEPEYHPYFKAKEVEVKEKIKKN